MHEQLMSEIYPSAGMKVSAIDGYVGTIVSVNNSNRSVFTVFMESPSAFVDLTLFYVDRISADHVQLNVNKQSLDGFKDK